MRWKQWITEPPDIPDRTPLIVAMNVNTDRPVCIETIVRFNRKDNFLEPSTYWISYDELKETLPTKEEF